MDVWLANKYPNAKLTVMSNTPMVIRIYRSRFSVSIIIVQMDSAHLTFPALQSAHGNQWIHPFYP